MTNNERLTDEDRRTIDMFVSMLAELRVGEHGPASDNHLGYLNPLAKLCLDVEAITMVGYTPEEILLRRVARLTSDLITRVVLAGGDAIVREWLIARSELLRVRSAAEGPRRRNDPMSTSWPPSSSRSPGGRASR